MTHAFHDTLPGFDPGNVLHDGCPECEERSQSPLSGLCHLDDSNFARLWRDMLAEKWSGGSGLTRAVSDCDLRLMNALYTIAVLLERNAGLDPHALADRIDNTRAVMRARLGLVA